MLFLADLIHLGKVLVYRNYSTPPLSFEILANFFNSETSYLIACREGNGVRHTVSHFRPYLLSTNHNWS
jgi:hypothetical protein